MRKLNNIGLSVFLSLFSVVFLIMPFISSCGKTGNVSPSSLNIQFQIVNLSPDLGSVDLYIKYLKVNNYSYFYPSSSGYFYLTSIDTPFQIRPGSTLTSGTVTSTSNIFSFKPVLRANLKYTLFITGLKTDKIDSVFSADTSSLPTTGRGKLRFINLSPRSTGLDLVANGTSSTSWNNIQYLKSSNYVELPAGNYDFQIFPTGSRQTVLKDYQHVIIQDGRIYTLYSYGLVGHADSLAFGEGIIINK